MDWFERLTGFKETGYQSTKSRLRIEDGRLQSLVNGKSYKIGQLDVVSLAELRQRRASLRGKLSVSLISANVQELHRQEMNAGALFQVASQFNLLEMTGPTITPEDGVTIYQNDRTQGPACAIAAGAATIYRNYFAAVGNQIGQTTQRQIDCLADLGQALSNLASLPGSQLWEMRNGYALVTDRGLKTIGKALASLSTSEIDRLRGLMRIGLHSDVEVTDNPQCHGQLVSQAFCSALPLGYGRGSSSEWEPLARLVLEAAYEATLHCAAENAARHKSRLVYLTLLGAGAFGNPLAWVLEAIERALDALHDSELQVVIVSFGAPPSELTKLAAKYEALR